MFYFFAAVLLIWVGDEAYDFASQTATTANFVAKSSIADSLVIYGNAAIAYAEANPTVTGPVQVALLALPSWVNVTRSDLSVFAQAGRGFAYYTGPIVGGLAAQVSAQSQYGVTSGTVVSGQIISPLLGTVTSIAVPNVIPSGSVVVTN